MSTVLNSSNKNLNYINLPTESFIYSSEELADMQPIDGIFMEGIFDFHALVLFFWYSFRM
jgi:hypothetical protein